MNFNFSCKKIQITQLNLFSLIRTLVDITQHYFIIYKYANIQRRIFIIFRFELSEYEINDSTAEIMVKAAFNFVYVTRIILLRVQFYRISKVSLQLYNSCLTRFVSSH